MPMSPRSGAHEFNSIGCNPHTITISIMKLRNQNTYEIIEGVAHVDVSTESYPSATMLIDETDWNYIRSLEPSRVGNYVTRTNRYASIWHNGKTALIHRLLLPDAIMVDHENHNGLDNRRLNIREASVSDNAKNRREYSSNKSGVTGVSRHKASGKWQAQIGVGGNTFPLGTFYDIEDAISARQAAEVKHGFHKNHGKK